MSFFLNNLSQVQTLFQTWATDGGSVLFPFLNPLTSLSVSLLCVLFPSLLFHSLYFLCYSYTSLRDLDLPFSVSPDRQEQRHIQCTLDAAYSNTTSGSLKFDVALLCLKWSVSAYRQSLFYQTYIISHLPPLFQGMSKQAIQWPRLIR